MRKAEDSFLNNEGVVVEECNQDVFELKNKRKIDLKLKTAISNYRIKIAGYKRPKNHDRKNTFLNEASNSNLFINDSKFTFFEKISFNKQKSGENIFGKENKKPSDKSFLKIFKSKKKKSYKLMRKNNSESSSLISSFPVIRYNNSEIINTDSQPSNSLYTSLSRKQLQKMNEFKNKVIKEKGSCKNFFREADITNFDKKKINKTNLKTGYLTKKGSGDKPFIFPIMNIHDKAFKTVSQKNRFERNYQTLLNLKCRIQDDKDNANNYIKEFLNKNGFFEEIMVNEKSLDKFIQFLQKDFEINSEKTLKQIILEILNVIPDIPNRAGGIHQISEENSESLFKIQNYHTKSSSFPKTVKNFFPSSHHFHSKKDLSEKVPLDKPNEFFEIKKEFNERKLYDTANIKNLCFKLEKEFSNLGVQTLDTSKLSIKNTLIRDNEIIGPLSTFNQNQIGSRQYQEFKKKNKLLELIIWKKTKNQLLINEEKKRMNIYT